MNHVDVYNSSHFRLMHDAYSIHIYDLSIIDMSDITLNCTIFECYDTNIAKLPNLPCCMYIDCHSCKITEISHMPNCVCADFSHNSITNMLTLPKCKYMLIDGNLCSKKIETSTIDKFINKYNELVHWFTHDSYQSI